MRKPASRSRPTDAAQPGRPISDERSVISSTTRRACARSGAKVQVQLVPSGGMEIHADSICVEPGGLVFHCDGLKKGPKGTVRGFGAFSTAIQVSGDAKTSNALKPLAKYDPHADWKKALDGLFLTDVDAPSATLYPPVALPTLPSSSTP